MRITIYQLRRPEHESVSGNTAFRNFKRSSPQARRTAKSPLTSISINFTTEDTEEHRGKDLFFKFLCAPPCPLWSVLRILLGKSDFAVLLVRRMRGY